MRATDLRNVLNTLTRWIVQFGTTYGDCQKQLVHTVTYQSYPFASCRLLALKIAGFSDEEIASAEGRTRGSKSNIDHAVEVLRHQIDQRLSNLAQGER